ncbi:hypothetical protein [Agrilutibacter solisilvae]|uniref:Uncharacterized protein n=1 Tax=Agrilutibacter solisilvae TaxID=2763317 RepID=A0A974Y1J0_9GAMM|nr:hypothetical protein [Lysobacter solisilvae]QSX78875.1 hypothetical protein I8J32_002830 [Lysobacter solisilvae]
MLKPILPAVVDNRLPGPALAVWLFVPQVFMKLALGMTHILRADGGAQSISRMPLDTYPDGAAQNVIALMARMGLEQLLMGALFLVVLLRYRALIPLMYCVVVLQFVAHRLVAGMKPLALAGASGVGAMQLVVAGLAVVGLLLALWPHGQGDPR